MCYLANFDDQKQLKIIGKKGTNSRNHKFEKKTYWKKREFLFQTTIFKKKLGKKKTLIQTSIFFLVSIFERVNFGVISKLVCGKTNDNMPLWFCHMACSPSYATYFGFTKLEIYYHGYKF